MSTIRPFLKYAEARRAFEQAGWVHIGASGDHDKFRNPTTGDVAVIPFRRNGQISKGVGGKLLKILQGKRAPAPGRKP